MTFARRTYRIAAIYGLIVTLPAYFLESRLNPPVSHPEQYYGFLGVVLAWQGAFWLIGGDPLRYRPLMPVTWVEKAGFAIPAVILFLQGRVDAAVLAVGLIDAGLCVAFVIAFIVTGRSGTTEGTEYTEKKR
ncbi:MAG TPA: hypothetical protein VF595_15015 [Tepidisphaeraceae bacterium]